MDYRHICTAGMVALHDLQTAHKLLEDGPESMNLRLVLIRHLILEIANIADLAAISGRLYKNHPNLGELYKATRTDLDFFKYLRNIYVGHFTPDLTAKTFEWLPYTNAFLGSNKLNKQLGISWFALETAINTYAAPETGHKIFPSDTDLNYPSDLTRFLNLLGETALDSMSYATKLVAVTRSYVTIPDLDKELLGLAITAGQTDFEFLTKRRR